MDTRYYECGICGHCHPWDFNGDCRDDDNRFTNEELDNKHGGPENYTLATMDERVAANGFQHKPQTPPVELAHTRLICPGCGLGPDDCQCHPGKYGASCN